MSMLFLNVFDFLAGLVPWVIFGLVVGLVIGIICARFILYRDEQISHKGYTIAAVVGTCIGGILFGLALGFNLQFAKIADKAYNSIKPSISSALNLTGIDPNLIPAGKVMVAVDTSLDTLRKVGGSWGDEQADTIREKILSIPGFATKDISLDDIYQQIKSAVVFKMGQYIPFIYVVSILLPLIFILLLRFSMWHDIKQNIEKKNAAESGQIMF